jgi:branched-subunit amino acid ABC-type transport system permease component
MVHLIAPLPDLSSSSLYTLIALGLTIKYEITRILRSG